MMRTTPIWPSVVLAPRPAQGNSGIVPPWLRQPAYPSVPAIPLVPTSPGDDR